MESHKTPWRASKLGSTFVLRRMREGAMGDDGFEIASVRDSLGVTWSRVDQDPLDAGERLDDDAIPEMRQVALGDTIQATLSLSKGPCRNQKPRERGTDD